MTLTLGLPRMRKEASERRDFLPKLVQAALGAGCTVLLEHGVGAGMQLTDDAYTSLSPRVKVVDAAGAWQADVVLVLRSPEYDEYERLLRRGTTLVSMLHLPTRPRRVAALERLGVDAVSLDGLTDDAGVRLVENTRAVGWNGLDAAFGALQRFTPARLAPGEPPVSVLVMGTGLVGRHAIDAATKWGSIDRAARWRQEGRPAVLVTAVGRSAVSDAALLRRLFSQCDVLVDATQRDDPSVPLIPNAWLASLPAHAVVCDLVVDPYVLAATPPTVRSIEGIPRGDLDQYVFAPDDPKWSATMPHEVPQTHRRAVVSCYSWPGVKPRECMEHYGRQLAPLLVRLLEVGGVSGLKGQGDFLDRALYRASLKGFHHLAHPDARASSSRNRPNE